MGMLERMRLQMEGENAGEIDPETGYRQLALAMDALGLDTTDETAQDQFINLLKLAVKNKAQLKKRLTNFTQAKAAKAMKAAKAAQ